MSRREKQKELAGFLAFAVAMVLFLCVISAILIPKRHDYGATWSSYLKEERESVDLMFFGSSMVYCNVIPAVLWEETGYTSYVMAGPEQTLPATYYYIREALKTQQPKAVFVEVTGAFFQPNTSFDKVNVGYMPWGANRLVATFEAAESGEWLGLLFPPNNYHDRWHQIGRTDLREGLFGGEPDPLAGYTMMTSYAPQPEVQAYQASEDAANYARNIEYLNKIARLCREQGTDVVFYITPSYGRLPEDCLSMLKSEALEGNHFVDFNERFDAMGIDPAVDFYDFLHFNYVGAEKFTVFLGQYLEELGWEFRPSGSADLWAERLGYFRTQVAEYPLTLHTPE